MAVVLALQLFLPKPRVWCQSDVTVSQQGGDLQVQWGGVGEEVWLSGPAELVFTGEVSGE